MKASSESGECASLISTGSFSVFCTAGCPAMSFFNFLAFCRLSCKESIPFRWVRSELEEENVRDAGTCEAPCRVFFRRESLTYRGHPHQLPAGASRWLGGNFCVCRFLKRPSCRASFASTSTAACFPPCFSRRTVFSSSQFRRKAYNPHNEVRHETSTGTGTFPPRTNPHGVRSRLASR